MVLAAFTSLLASWRISVSFQLYIFTNILCTWSDTARNSRNNTARNRKKNTRWEKKKPPIKATTTKAAQANIIFNLL